MPKPTPEIDRFLAKIERADSGCWLWTAYVDPKGYGRFKTPGECRPHRWSYRNYVGPIPDGMVIDHLCRTRHCVNPEHLRAVTARENTFAEGSVAPAKRLAESDRCTSGHLFTPQTTRIEPGGRRRCRICLGKREAAARIAKRSATCSAGHRKVMNSAGKLYCPPCHSAARRRTEWDPSKFACGHDRATAGRTNRRGYQYCGTCKEEITRARWARRKAA